MVTILENQRRMNREEIVEEFRGKWVFLVDLEGPPLGRFETAIPAVMADDVFEGRETGIYDRLNEEYNGNTADVTYLRNLPNPFGFIELVPEDD
ncbi:MAG: hypothetical protein FWG69_06360 [Oscillospiraceae bacterium]|nr:hypothetical protein [Oscillospiraceae bacterium]